MDDAIIRFWLNRPRHIVAFEPGYAELAQLLTKGTQLFVQGELTIREYDRTIQIANGQKTTDHVIQQLVVELKPTPTASSTARPPWQRRQQRHRTHRHAFAPVCKVSVR